MLRKFHLQNNIVFGLVPFIKPRRIYVDPSLPSSSYTPFVSFLDAFAPGTVGEINHSKVFFNAMGQCMVAHAQLCACLEHWAIIPALGIPSDFARVLDGYTCEGESCQILIHVVTRASGELDWFLVDVVPNANSKGAGSGIHKFKTAESLVSLLRCSEADRMVLTDRDARRRHAVTCGDGAYVGHHSIHLMREWQRQVPGARSSAVSGSAKSAAGSGGNVPRASASTVDGAGASVSAGGSGASTSDGCSSPFFLEASCEFHILQRIGKFADSKFLGARKFDKLLRDLESEFIHASYLYIRGAALQLSLSDRKLLAPRSDGFKVTVYSKNLHIRFIYNHQILHIALAAKLHVLYHNARIEAWARYERRLIKFQAGELEKQPSKPGPNVGRGVKRCRQVRALGRALLDPHSLIFGIGRGDLRNLFLAGYATLTQNYKISALVKTKAQHDFCAAMSNSVRNINSLCNYLRIVGGVACCGGGSAKGSARSAEGSANGVLTLRLIVKVIVGHCIWRIMPNVTKILPDLLFPRDGVHRFLKVPCRVEDSPFMEARPKKKGPAQDAHDQASHWRARPQYYMHSVEQALQQLARWLRMELIYFKKEIIFWDGETSETGAQADEVALESDSSDSSSDSGSDSSSSTESDGDDSGHAPGPGRGPGADAIHVAARVQGAGGSAVGSEEVGSAVGLEQVGSEESADGSASDDVEVDPADHDARVDPTCSAPPLESASIRHWSRLAQLGHVVVRARVNVQHVTRFPSVRRQMWECAAMTFHPDILVKQWSVQSLAEQGKQLQALRYVFDFWSPSLFHALEWEAAAFKFPPPEMFQEVSFDEFRDQYIRWRDIILPRVLKEADSAECWKVERVLVRIGQRTMPVGLERVEFCESSPLDRVWGGDQSLAFGSDSCLGREVYVSLKGPMGTNPDRPLGRSVGIIVGFEKHIVEGKLYKKFMTMEYLRVHESKIWHVLRMYHRLMMAGMSTEALAELVGSLLSIRVRTQNGHHRSLSHTIGSARLRCFGVYGDPGDIGFISRSLDIYFRGKPWHFGLKDRCRRERQPRCWLGPSVAVHNHRVQLMSHRRQFSWLPGSLTQAYQNFGRVDFRIGQDHTNFTTPRVGLMLKDSRSRIEMYAKLAKAARVYEPTMMDVRVVGGFGT